MRPSIFVSSALLCGLLAAAAPALAEEAPAHHSSPLAGVIALEKPVTYTETKIPLGELVAKVAADTSVKLTASKEVADEPVAVVVKAMPARELLEEVASLLDYRWARRGGDTPPRYEVYQDAASRQHEAALRAAAFADAEQFLRAEIRRWGEMARLSGAEIQRVRDTAEQELEKIAALPWDRQQARLRSPDPWKWFEQDRMAKVLARPIVRTVADLAGSLSPEQWSLLRARRRLVFSSRPARGELPLPARFARLFRAATYRGSADRVDGPPQQTQQINEQLRQMQGEWDRATGYHVILQYDPTRFMTGAGLYLDATAIPSPSPRASLFETGNRLVIAGRAGDLDLPGLALPADERPARATSDPVLGRTAALAPSVQPRRDSLGLARGPLWPLWELLPDLARAYGVQCIANAYWSTDAVYGLQFPPEDRTLESELEYLSGGRYSRDRQDDLIRLRSKTWFLDRPREIPLHLVRGWQESYARRGELTFEQYVTAGAALTDLQLQSTKRLIRRGVLPERAFSLESAYDARSALRLYATFTPAQKRALREGHSLSGARWSARQRELFHAALQPEERGGGPPGRPVEIRWDHAAFSLSSEAMLSVTDKTHGSQFQATGPVSKRRPGLRTGPLPPRTPPAMALAGIPTAPGQERHSFTAVHLQVAGSPGLHQEYVLYVAGPA